jgi:hypothetical protein
VAAVVLDVALALRRRCGFITCVVSFFVILSMSDGWRSCRLGRVLIFPSRISSSISAIGFYIVLILATPHPLTS